MEADLALQTDNLPLYQPRGAPGADRTVPAPTTVAIAMPTPRRQTVDEPEGFATYLGTILLKGSVPAKSSTYDPTLDVDSIYKACHGMGTNNNKLIKVLVDKVSHIVVCRLQTNGSIGIARDSNTANGILEQATKGPRISGHFRDVGQLSDGCGAPCEWRTSRRCIPTRKGETFYCDDTGGLHSSRLWNPRRVQPSDWRCSQSSSSCAQSLIWPS